MVVECKDSYLKKYAEECLRDLGISACSVVIEVDDLADGINGFCYDESETNLIIALKERCYSDMCLTLSHELAHVKQYIEDDLGRHLDLNPNAPYDSRWWEIEANEEGQRLYYLNFFLNDE